MRLDPSRPLGDQVYTHLCRGILAGEIPPGSRLPSSRRLAADLGISRNTVLWAYERLMLEGYIEGRQAAGTFVVTRIPCDNLATQEHLRRAGDRPPTAVPDISALGRRVAQYASVRPDRDEEVVRGLRYDFGVGRPLTDRTALRAWNRILRRRANAAEAVPEAAPQLQTMSASLQTALCAYFRRTRGVVAAPDQVVIVTSSQQAFQLTARLMLDPGDKVVLEEPHYMGVRNAFLAAGAQVIPVEVDQAGMRVDAIPLEAAGAKLIYVVPSQQWPTGGVMPLARRLQVLQWAAENRAYVIEDDFNCEYQYHGPPIESLQGIAETDRVLYSGTLTRLFLPLHPVGFLIIPQQLVDAFRALAVLESFYPSAFEQDILAEFIAQGHFDRLTRRVRRRTEPLHRFLAKTLRSRLGDHMDLFPSRAGFHMYGRLRSVLPSQADQLIRRAAQRGVGLYPDLPFYLQPPEKLGLVFGIGEMSTDEMTEGLTRLAQILRAWE